MKYYLTINNKANDIKELDWARDLYFHQGLIWHKNQLINSTIYQQQSQEFGPCDPHNLKHIACFCMSFETEDAIKADIGNRAMAAYKAGLITQTEIPVFSPDCQLKIVKPDYKKGKGRQYKNDEKADLLILNLRFVIRKLIQEKKSLKGMNNADYKVDDHTITVIVNNDANVKKYENHQDRIIYELATLGHFDINILVDKEQKYTKLRYSVPLKKDIELFQGYNRLHYYVKELKEDTTFLLRLIGRFSDPSQISSVKVLRRCISVIEHNKIVTEGKGKKGLNDSNTFRYLDYHELDSALDYLIRNAISIWHPTDQVYKIVFRKYYDFAMFVSNYLKHLDKNKTIQEFPDINTYQDIHKKKLILGQTTLLD